MYKDRDILAQRGSITLENELKLLSACKSMQELFEYVEDRIPKWIVSKHDKYCTALDQLNTTWETVCINLGTFKKQIVLVRFLPSVSMPPAGNEFEGFKIIEKVCDALTSNGFLVREHTSFTPCSTCTHLILSKKAHTFLQTKYLCSMPRPSPLLPLEWTSNGC